MDAPLSAKDYQDVRKALWAVRPQWDNIGLELGFLVTKINELEELGSFDKKFDKMVEVWLNHTFSTPTWGALVKALRDVTVNGGKPVAAEIEAKYGSPKQGQLERERSAGQGQTEGGTGVKPGLKMKPTMYDLKFKYKVVQGVQAKWEELAYALIFETSDVETIKRNTGDDVMNACTHVLSEWREGKGGRGPRNWETLLEALTDIGKTEMVTEIRQKL